MSVLSPPRPKLYTAHDLECLPNDVRYELIRGELRLMPNNSAEHGNVTFDFSLDVGLFVREHDLGRCFAAETRFTIEKDPDTTLAPDFAFVSKERLPDPIPAKGYLELAPDIVLETVSPNDTKREVNLKVAQWLRAGTRIVWVLHPSARTLTVHRAGETPRVLGAEETLTGEEVLPGFEMPLRKIFVSA
jgi:Uma2 family endonuclease